MGTTFFVSYIYELFGRRKTLFVSLVLTAIVVAAIPYTAPNLDHLMYARCIFAITLTAPIVAPLVPDYIVRAHRGRAVALGGIGLAFGEVFAMGVLFNLTKAMTYREAFGVVGAFILLIAIFLWFSVKDPDSNLAKSSR